MHAVLRFLRSLGIYLSVVVGGITLFLILAPVFGYLPYSDRPGPGWYGSFPGLSLRAFFSNAGKMLEFGVFFAVVFLTAGIIIVGAIRLVELVVRPPNTVRVSGGLISAVLTGFWMLGAGWYISAGWPLLMLSIVLGAVAGACCLPRKGSTAHVGA